MGVSFGAVVLIVYITSLIGLAYEYATAPVIADDC